MDFKSGDLVAKEVPESCFVDRQLSLLLYVENHCHAGTIGHYSA
jgi:hypothetical protein